VGTSARTRWGCCARCWSAGSCPELVVGTSIGAINGAAVAGEPSVAAAERLAEMWVGFERSDVFGGSVLGRLGTLARTRTHLHGNEGLRRLLGEALPAQRIEDLAVAFECVAASIEAASEHWFTSGSLVDAVLASSAVPGILPPVEIDGEHFLDGGIVNSIPVGRAVARGARTIYVMHVGRVDRPLEPPRWPWEVGLVAFEIARRHRFLGDIASLPDGLDVHVLPTGQPEPPRYTAVSQLRYRDMSRCASTSSTPTRRRRRTSTGWRAPVRSASRPTVVRRLVLAPARRRARGRAARALAARPACSPPCSALCSAGPGRCAPRTSSSRTPRTTCRRWRRCSPCWARRDGSQEAHYDVMRRFVAGVYRAIVRAARVEVTTDESAAAYRALAGGERPVVLLSRHGRRGRHVPRALRAALPPRAPAARRDARGAAARPGDRRPRRPAAQPVRRPARRRHRGGDRGDGARDGRRRGRS
jgi:NTE family protein